MKRILLLSVLAATAAFGLGCVSGEGARSYVLGDVYGVIPPSTNTTIEVLNQHVTSSTGRDRVTKPSADLTVTPSP